MWFPYRIFIRAFRKQRAGGSLRGPSARPMGRADLSGDQVLGGVMPLAIAAAYCAQVYFWVL